MDTFDELAQKWFSSAASGPDADVPQSPFRRVIMFVDNAGQPGPAPVALSVAQQALGSFSGCGPLECGPYRPAKHARYR